MNPDVVNKKDAISFLNISEKEFDNYFKMSRELQGQKIGSRWMFDKSLLQNWQALKKDRTVKLSIDEYEECFEFAIKMVYSSKAMGGAIRGARSEVQASDDWILGILAEYGIRKFLSDKFGFKIKLDTEVHPDYITPQDIEKVYGKGVWRNPKMNIGIKASKFKNCFLIISELEYMNLRRKSDVYIFARIGLPSDHLFRILREHSFFKNVRQYLEKNASKGFRQLNKLEEIPIWICGFSYSKELERVKEIPGQKFDIGFRYVKSVSDMHNSDEDWRKLISSL